jgi:hypothetical protein
MGYDLEEVACIVVDLERQYVSDFSGHLHCELEFSRCLGFPRFYCCDPRSTIKGVINLDRGKVLSICFQEMSGFSFGRIKFAHPKGIAPTHGT